MVKLAKAANKQANQKKKAPPPPKEVDEESSEEDSEEEEEETPPPKVVKKATPAKAAKVNAKNGQAAKKAKSEDDEEESDEESEEEPPPPKKGAKPAAKAKQLKAKPAKEPSDDDEDDDDDDDEESEEEAPPPKAAKQGAKPKAKPAKQEEEDEEDEEEDESGEEMDTAPAPAAAKAKKAGMVKAEESEDEDDDEEDDEEEEDDDEEEDEDDEAEDAPATPAKRKAGGKKDTPPAKKAKSDGEGFCLYVGNLNANKEFDEIKDAMRKFFSKNDLEVSDVRLGGSKKFGYVEFSSEEDMEKALELNGKKVMGQEIKIDRAKTKGASLDSKKERDSRTLFVKNLPFAITADELKEVFEDAVDVRVPLGQNGTGRGIAYIEFKSEADAEKTLEDSQGSDIQGRSIVLDYVGEKSQKGPNAFAAAAPASKTLVVNNLAFSATEETLQSMFEKAVSIRIPQRDGRPKGFAFLEFDSTEDAKEAIETMNNTELEGRTMRLEFSQNSGGRSEGGPTKTLFVKGLSEDTTDQTLKAAFDTAVGARIVTDRETGYSKCFGFVDFDNEDDCKAAKEAMDQGEIDGNSVTLDYAKPKGEGGFRGGRGGGGFGGGRGGRGGFGGGRGGRGGGGGYGGRGGGGFGGGFGGRGRGGPRGGGRGRGGFGGGRGGGGFGGKPQGKRIKFDE
ncbi:nucleolin isoform X1 [Syngnathus typhle]|uniref:nucleolin isoform X1 n=1 Tax=Syngnathus typhle TaxID=161592 RepID=UPI002A6A1092|nr:nucleolin isoform X1 [Syngnathus typhle]